MLHVPRPEQLTEEELRMHISRVKWLFKHKFVYGVELTPGAITYRNEDVLQSELENIIANA